jgi:hypothetical protein
MNKNIHQSTESIIKIEKRFYVIFSMKKRGYKDNNILSIVFLL